MGILKILFALIFVLFPLGVLIRISVTNQAYIYPVDIAVFLFVTYGMYFSHVKNKKRKINFPIYFFIAIAVVSLVINLYWLSAREFFVSSLYIVRLVMYLLIVPIIANSFTKKDIKYVVSAITTSLGVVVIGGLIQYFLYPDLRNLMYMGWDEHLYRVFSSFLDPNFASIIFVLFLWMLIYLLKIQKQKNLMFFILIGMTLCTFLVTLLTYSRTGYLALAASLLVYLIASKNIKLFVGLIAVFILGIFLLPKNYRSEGVNLFRTASIESRIHSYGTAVVLWKKSPLIGVGFNSYRYAQEHFIPNGNSIEKSHAGAGTSNSYLFILATTGIVGLAAFIYFGSKIFNMIMRIQSLEARHISLVLFSVILFGSVTENVFFYSFILILISCYLGILNIVTGKNEQ